MHFHQLLRWSHEAYEESLKRYGIPAAEVFPRPGSIPAVALPIVHCEADYLRPLACGDPLAIALRPRQRNESSFEVTYRFYSDGTETARALSRHQAIDPVTRRATELPSAILRWLEASIPAVGGLAL
jgi:1,4-dihydroxy-2-naphthoyl-CoA hydrolase